MWIFTRAGFFSVTAGHSNKIQIRARNEEHLYNLKKLFPELEKRNILTGVATDYLHRLIVSKDEWKHISAVLSAEVEHYGNFKNECAKQVTAKKLDDKYVGLLHDIWHRHLRYQINLNKKFPFKDEQEEFAWSSKDTQDVLEEQGLDPYYDPHIPEPPPEEDYADEEEMRKGLFEGVDVPQPPIVVEDVVLRKGKGRRPVAPTWIRHYGNK